LITGAAPCEGKDIDEVLFAAHQCVEPSFAADVDEELAGICKKAMKRNPDERYQSIDEVREALVVFRSHAAAHELARVAEERLAALLAIPAAAWLRKTT